VRRWPASSGRRVDRWARVVLWPVGAAMGLASERAAYGWDSFSSWIPDLIVGLVFTGCGIHALARNRGTAVLLSITGLTWFLANFWNDALFVHRGLLVHLLVAYPGWRVRSRLDLLAVSGGYAAAVFLPVWRSEVATIAIACMLLGVAARNYVVAPVRLRRIQRTALIATTVFGGALAAGTVLRLNLTDADAASVVPLVYEGALSCIALVLSAGLIAGDASNVVDLIVELGESRSGTLRDALATTLNDPTLEVGYWDRQSRYVDNGGRVVTMPPAGASRSATFVERDAQPFAVLVHDASILGEPALVESVAAATRLSTVHVELQDVVREQLVELSESRRRLVSAADEERRRLDNRLRDGAERHLREIDELLRIEMPAQLHRVGRAQELLAQTIADVRELAGGLHPRILDLGLVPALESLTSHSPVPVKLVVQGDVSASAAQTAIYYVCSEALTNIVKHAEATSASIVVAATAGGVTVEVSDDGSGGADAGLGTGLRGLVDRVEALGGTVGIDSPPTAGTRVVVQLPNEAHESGSCQP
jgi:signal transduction histidine kinase